MGVVIRRWVWFSSRRRVWLAGGMYGFGYQEVGVVGFYWCG